MSDTGEDVSVIEIIWRIANDDEPENGSWSRTITTKRLGTGEMTAAVNAAILAIRETLRAPAP